MATEAQLTALRSQVNPHFLFNALTTIGYLIKAAPERAYDTLLRLTQLLRGVLNATGEFTTLGEEICIIESYLDIERARFEERLAVRIDIPNELENIELPSLILQPLVENAIKHAVSENRNGGAVEVTARAADGVIRLRVADTGRGGGASGSSGGGVGLTNIRERLNAYYGNAAAVELRDNPYGGTTAEIILPFERKTMAAANEAK
jgi:LytS/YehU family sensor histidine kinase